MNSIFMQICFSKLEWMTSGYMNKALFNLNFVKVVKLFRQTVKFSF